MVRTSPTAAATARLLAGVIGASAVLAGCGGAADDRGPAATARDAGPAPVARTTSGDLRGVRTARARTFLGVRFAQPPTGRRRWTLPRAVDRRGRAVDATRPGARCAQTGARGTGSTSEDCLFLNVTTPRDAAPGDDLPVVVWWHGGGFTSGAGSDYDAQRLAERGRVVVVTANSRLGVFGYLGLPGLEGSGDFGFADQIAALRWARTNARAFGGDPHSTTVAGQSAGAMSACALLTSPSARGLVDRVAMSSGSCGLRWPAGGLVPGAPAQTPYARASDNRALGAATAKRLGCTGTATLRCLRGKPVRDLLPTSAGFANQLAYGTPLLPRDPAAQAAAGRIARVPVLSGGTEGEERSFVGGAEQAKPGTITARTFPAMLRRAFGRDAARVARAYPVARYRSPAAAFAAVMGDAAWSCPTLRTDRDLARVTTVHRFEFADPRAPDVNGVPSTTVPQGATHATDLPFLFDLGGRSLLRTDAQRRLSDTMIDLWSSFARTGRPTAPGVRWPASTPSSPRTLRLAPGAVGPTDVAREHRCGLWRSVGRAGRG